MGNFVIILYIVPDKNFNILLVYVVVIGLIHYSVIYIVMQVIVL